MIPCSQLLKDTASHPVSQQKNTVFKLWVFRCNRNLRESGDNRGRNHFGLGSLPLTFHLGHLLLLSFLCSCLESLFIYLTFWYILQLLGKSVRSRIEPNVCCFTVDTCWPWQKHLRNKLQKTQLGSLVWHWKNIRWGWWKFRRLQKLLGRTNFISAVVLLRPFLLVTSRFSWVWCCTSARTSAVVLVFSWVLGSLIGKGLAMIGLLVRSSWAWTAAKFEAQDSRQFERPVCQRVVAMMWMMLCLVLLTPATSMRSNSSNMVEEVKKEKGPGFDFNMDGLMDEIKKQSGLNAVIAAVRAVNGGACPKSFSGIPDGWDYGVGCAFHQSALADANTESCHCPGVFEVCATAPRFSEVKDISSLIARASVSQLGYCRTGWVFLYGFATFSLNVPWIPKDRKRTDSRLVWGSQ